MFKMMFSIKITLLSCLVVVATMVVQGQVTRMGFYAGTCPQAEAVVRATVESHFGADPSIAPGLLRMHFHDCFVRGCDGSILVDGVDTEKTALPNLPLRGFDVIADAKKQLEDECPGVVSCADVLALAARDSVVLTGGQSWEVPTGRRDGRVSMASDFANFPSFSDSVAVQIQKFSELGLTTEDLVTLVGGHTIGTAACRTFAYRIYNFSSTGRPDPSINSTFLPQLRKLCPQIGGGDRRVVLDAGRHPDHFDTSFFENLRTGQGILESDQALWANAITRSIVGRFLDDDAAGLRFGFEFAKAMVKMGNLGVKNGSMGEIRKVCSAIN